MKDFDEMFAEALQNPAVKAAYDAEVKREEAEPKPDIDAEIAFILERHAGTIKALADR